MTRRDTDVVKSVARVFEVLELFQTVRRPLTAAEVGRELAYPPSSTICLLKSMATLGYLAFDCLNYKYLPTLRLPMLGDWIGEGGIRWDIQHLMQAVHRDTGESVALCVESDGGMIVLAISASDDIASFSTVSAVGDRAPLFDSVAGLTSLSMQSDQQVMQLAGQLLRRPRHIRPRINITDSLERIRRIRDSGFGVAYDLSVPDVGALAWPITSRYSRKPLVLGVWGPAARIKACEFRVIAQVNAALGPGGTARSSASFHFSSNFQTSSKPTI